MNYTLEQYFHVGSYSTQEEAFVVACSVMAATPIFSGTSALCVGTRIKQVGNLYVVDICKHGGYYAFN